MQEKLCPKCNQNKSVLEFSRDSRTKSGIRSQCRACCRESSIKYYTKTRERHIKESTRWNRENNDRFLANQVRRRKEIKAEIVRGYGGEKEIAFLTLEHINGGGRKHREHAGSLAVYREVIKKDFPSEYTVLRMNCNFARRFGRECPNQEKGNIRDELLEALVETNPGAPVVSMDWKEGSIKLKPLRDEKGGKP